MAIGIPMRAKKTKATTSVVSNSCHASFLVCPLDGFMSLPSWSRKLCHIVQYQLDSVNEHDHGAQGQSREHPTL